MIPDIHGNGEISYAAIAATDGAWDCVEMPSGEVISSGHLTLSAAEDACVFATRRRDRQLAEFAAILGADV